MTSPIPTGTVTAPNSVDGGSSSSGALTPSQIDEFVLTDVSPKNPPPMQTLVYSPDVQILIAHGNQQFDVSDDIVAWSVRRVENSVSSVVFKLANKDLRYNQRFERMDRVIVKLKRVEWIQVFSGYLDSVPHVQLYPGTVNFRASCTLKRLLHTWWDPGLQASSEIFNQAGANEQQESQGEMSLDKGLGSMLRNLLVKVGGWNVADVHIQNVPTGYFNYMKRYIQETTKTDDANVREFQRLLLGDDTSLGVGAAAGRQLGVTRGAYSLTAPERMLEVLRAVDEMSMGPDNRDIAAAQALGLSATGGEDEKDQPAWKGITETGKNWTEAAQKNDAAVHCFMTIAVESNWLMYANNAVPESLNFPHDAVGHDHDSIGLFQQRPSWGSTAQRMNPRESAGMFLNELNKFDWRNMDRGAACQKVQRSALPGKYALHEQEAIEQVRALRAGTGSALGTGGQSAGVTGGGLGSSPLGSIPTAVTAGAPGASGIPSMPTTNGTPTAAGAGAVVGKPQFDTAGALSFARAQIGKPYAWGKRGPDSYDCSGLMQAAYRSIGLEIGQDTTSQAAANTHIPVTNLVPGDMLQPEPGHTVMWTGTGTIVHASTTGQPIKEVPCYFDPSTAVALHVPGTEYGGTPVAPYDPQRAYTGGGASPGTVAPGLGSGTAQVGSAEPIARNLFTYQFQAGQFANPISGYYGNSDETAEKAFINDEPLIQTVISFAKAGLRNFQSAPDGSFIAYYPDYFGLDGKNAVVHIEDVEMINVQIDMNDDALATHVYVAGSAMGMNAGGDGVVGWLRTKGVATVENEFLFRKLVQAAPAVPGQPMVSGKEIMKKFGARPLVQSMSGVQAGPMEFLLAVQIFMTKWAEQYATTIQTSFMPEVFPGMRLNLVGHNLQVYVTEVTHSGDFESGFTTSMVIMAPSNPTIAKMGSNTMNATDWEKWDQRDINGNASTVFN